MPCALAALGLPLLLLVPWTLFGHALRSPDRNGEPSDAGCIDELEPSWSPFKASEPLRAELERRKHGFRRDPRASSYKPTKLPAKEPRPTGAPPVRYDPERFRAWENWREGPWKVPPHKPPLQGRLAVLLAGKLKRLVFPELLKNVVSASKLLGYEVDIYASLVLGGNNASWFQGCLADFEGEPMCKELKGDALRKALTDAFAEVGGRVVHLNLREDSEEIVQLDSANETSSRKSRIFQYSPIKDEVGRNVLRRYKTLSELMLRAQAESAKQGWNYTWVLELREDLLWVQPLNLTMFRRSAALPLLYGIDCLSYGGINDKALLYNQRAGLLLSTRYFDFYNNSNPILDDTKNAESFLSAVCLMKNIDVMLVPVADLGPVSAMYRRRQGKLDICARKSGQMNCVNPPVMPLYCTADDKPATFERFFCSDVT